MSENREERHVNSWIVVVASGHSWIDVESRRFGLQTELSRIGRGKLSIRSSYL